MSRVRYSFSIRGDAPIGPGGTLYSVIGTRVRDEAHRDVGHVSHIEQTQTDLEIELSIYTPGVAGGAPPRAYSRRDRDAAREEVRLEIMSRLANWPVDEFAAVVLEAAGDVPKLIAAIAARASSE